MVEKIKNEVKNEDDGIYKFEELIPDRFYLRFKFNESKIQCGTVYMDSSVSRLEECALSDYYSIPLINTKKWERFISYLEKNKDNAKFYYGYLLPDQSEVFLTYPYETAIGAKLTLTHIVAGFINNENLDYIKL